MFTLAILIGIYSYGIFLLGIIGLLTRPLIFYYTLATAIAILSYLFVILAKVADAPRGKGIQLHQSIKAKIITAKKHIPKIKSKLVLLFLILFLLQASVNLLGALGPETAFDALWYHLTLPKLYLANQRIEFIPGGLLYYNAMPKLAEMLYIAGLAFGNEVTVKLIHFSFGLLTCLAIYKLSRKFFNQLLSLIAIVIFYSNLVIGWESITAYADLTRTFFEVMGLWSFLNWHETKKNKWLIISAVMIGFAITTKLLALGSLLIFSLILLFSSKQLIKAIKNLLTFLFFALLIPLPWLIFSYQNTGNPVYPFFSNIYKVTPEPLSIITFIKDTWILFTQSADPISPIYMIFLPLILLLTFYVSGKRGASASRIRILDKPEAHKLHNMNELNELKLIGIYSFFAIILWYFTPRTGGGRFILPYLPAFSILCMAVFSKIFNNSKMYLVKNFLLIIIIITSCISIIYRIAANSKYIPVIIGLQSKDAYLTNNLNFSFGDFYDTDGYFKRNIKTTDRILLFGFHNLYYADFPFIDSSWVKKGDSFNYIAIQNTKLPKQFKNWKHIYKNEKTHVELYSLGGKWEYWKY